MRAIASHGRPEAQGARIDLVRVKTQVPLFRRKSFVIEVQEGTCITLSLQWVTRARWRRSKDSRAGGWHAWEVCFIVIAFKVDY